MYNVAEKRRNFGFDFKKKHLSKLLLDSPPDTYYKS